MARTRRVCVHACSACSTAHVEPVSGPPARPQQHALFGFSEELDLRPLHFVEPPPPARVCSACGLVLMEAGLLPCGHILCRSCYEQGPQTTGGTCPLDGEVCPDEDVDWKEFPAESLMRRQVKCWNEANGCGAVVALSEICKHFRHDCRHHSTDCPKCSSSVLRSNLSVHLMSQCSVTGKLGNCSNKLEGSLAEKLDRIEESLRDVKAALQVSGDTNLAAGPATEQQEMSRALTANVGLASGGEGERTAFGVTSAGQEWSSSERSATGLSELQQSINGIKETALNEFRQLKAEVLRLLDTRFKEQATQLMEFQALLRDQVGKINAELGRLLAENGLQNDRLNEHFQSTITFRETVKKVFEEMSKAQNARLTEHLQSVCALRESVENELREILKQNHDSSSNIAACVTGMKDRITEGINTVLQHIGKSAKTHQWVMKDYAVAKQAAVEYGDSLRQSKRLYLCGYYMSLGLFFKANAYSVTVHLRLELHKGEMDEFLRWPFQEKMRLSIIHPGTREKRVITEGALFCVEVCLRPMLDSNNGVCSAGHIRSDELERDGYVKDDQLQVMFEMIT